ncbi:MAG: TIGR00374 family protein, partial [Prevotella sp.]|nr:TIGR00374 family protein [Prevotella sp.]
MDLKKIANNTWKVALSLFLGSAILFWMYRDFDFKQVEHVML